MVSVEGEAMRPVTWVTIEEFASDSTRLPATGSVTVISWSRTRFDVAANRQWTRVPAGTVSTSAPSRMPLEELPTRQAVRFIRRT
jgi:hypothetical protein